MPYVSDRQRRYFNANRAELEAQGVNVAEWNESTKGKKLPEQTKDGKPVKGAKKPKRKGTKTASLSLLMARVADYSPEPLKTSHSVTQGQESLSSILSRRMLKIGSCETETAQNAWLKQALGVIVAREERSGVINSVLSDDEMPEKQAQADSNKSLEKISRDTSRTEMSQPISPVRVAAKLYGFRQNIGNLPKAASRPGSKNMYKRAVNLQTSLSATGPAADSTAMLKGITTANPAAAMQQSPQLQGNPYVGAPGGTTSPAQNPINAYGPLNQSAQIGGGMFGQKNTEGGSLKLSRDAVLITGNPQYIENNPKATQFYDEIQELLANLGYNVSRDPGEEYTEPKPADLWVGHSRGADRLRFAPEGTRTVSLGAKGGINHPEDTAAERGDVPGDAHFTLTDAMRQKFAEAEETPVLDWLRQFYEPAEVYPADRRTVLLADDRYVPDTKLRPTLRLDQHSVNRFVTRQDHLQGLLHRLRDTQGQQDKLTQQNKDLSKWWSNPRFWGGAALGAGAMYGGKKLYDWWKGDDKEKVSNYLPGTQLWEKLAISLPSNIGAGAGPKGGVNINGSANVKPPKPPSTSGPVGGAPKGGVKIQAGTKTRPAMPPTWTPNAALKPQAPQVGMQPDMPWYQGLLPGATRRHQQQQLPYAGQTTRPRPPAKIPPKPPAAHELPENQYKEHPEYPEGRVTPDAYAAYYEQRKAVRAHNDSIYNKILEQRTNDWEQLHRQRDRLHHVNRSLPRPVIPASPTEHATTTESLLQNLQTQGYYDQLPGGAVGEAARAEQAAINDPLPGNPTVFTPQNIAKPMEIHWRRADPNNIVDNTVGGFMENSLSKRSPAWKHLIGHTINDPNRSRRSDPRIVTIFDERQYQENDPRTPWRQRNIEHELTHGAQYADTDKQSPAFLFGAPYQREHNMAHPVSLSESLIPRDRINPNFTSVDNFESEKEWQQAHGESSADYRTNWTEIDPRLAELKRNYSKATGKPVHTPEDAAEAWRWFKEKGTHIMPGAANMRKDIQTWETYPQDKDEFIQLLLRRMPQVVQHQATGPLEKLSYQPGSAPQPQSPTKPSISVSRGSGGPHTAQSSGSYPQYRPRVMRPAQPSRPARPAQPTPPKEQPLRLPENGPFRGALVTDPEGGPIYDQYPGIGQRLFSPQWETHQKQRFPGRSLQQMLGTPEGQRWLQMQRQMMRAK